jgi:hypothetical protein
MRSKEMTLQELRLFSIYLSKINPRDSTTRLVRFSMTDFQTIMELGRVNIAYFKDVAKSLLHKPVDISLDDGGFVMFNLFRVFKVATDEDGKWYVEINADDEALPLLFDYKGHYFKYELWNALRLKGKNQLRMYEVLKQCEGVGFRVVSVNELKGMLGIGENEYPQFKHFKQAVLEICKKALAENTDISFTYEPHSKKGRKIHELKFTITKNKNYIDPLGLDKFIDLKNKASYEDDYQDVDFNDIDENGNLRSTGTSPIYEERIAYLMSACNNEFSREEIIVLFDIMPSWAKHDENDSHDFLQSKYREMDMRKPKKSRFGYLKKMIADMKNTADEMVSV